MTETLRLILTKFTDETITVFGTLLLVTTGTIIAYWFYNRKKLKYLTYKTIPSQNNLKKTEIHHLTLPSYSLT